MPVPESRQWTTLAETSERRPGRVTMSGSGFPPGIDAARTHDDNPNVVRRHFVSSVRQSLIPNFEAKIRAARIAPSSGVDDMKRCCRALAAIIQEEARVRGTNLSVRRQDIVPRRQSS